MTPSLESLKMKAAEICKVLAETYGNNTPYNRLPPIDELVLTILSQNTSDVNSSRAFANLKERFPTWEEVLVASEEQVAQSISSCGLYNIKAQRIKATLSEIVRRVGRLDLTLLETMPLQEAKKWLTSLYGVGPKTAAIVLLFSFGRPALPVDTHVWRVTKRIGLIPPEVSRERAHELLEEIIKGDCVYSLNSNLVQHGRTICKAPVPWCEQCSLRELCTYYLTR